MQIFIKLKGFLRDLGLTGRTNRNDSIFNGILCATCSFTVLFIGIPSLLYVFLAADAFADRSEAIVAANSGCTNFAMYVILSIYRLEILDTISALEITINKQISPFTNILIYEAANRKSERFMKLYGIWMLKITVPLVVLPVICQPLVEYYILGSEKLDLRLAVRSWLPYNWQDPIAYLISVAIECVGFYFISYIYTSCYSILYGFCTFLVAMVDDLKQRMDKIDQFRMDNAPNTRNQSKSFFRQLLMFDIQARQLASKCSKITHYITCVIFVNVSIFCCTLLLQIHIGMRTNDYVLIVRAISVITGVLPFFFIYCKVGEDVTEAYGTIDDAIYMKSWYLCTNDTQNYLKLLMMMAQKEIDMRGFATFNCSCDTFKRVINGGYTYFMMLRRFN